LFWKVRECNCDHSSCFHTGFFSFLKLAHVFSLSLSQIQMIQFVMKSLRERGRERELMLKLLFWISDRILLCLCHLFGSKYNTIY
jgi:hypothetical protein